MTSSVGHLPGDRWSFDEEVTGCFEDMLRRSIPDLDGMRAAVAAITAYSVGGSGEGSTVVDLGTSRGGALESVRAALPSARLIGIEVSSPMLRAAIERFEDDPLAEIRDLDLRASYPEEQADATLSVLSLQFVPIEYRLRIVRDAYEHTRDGGVMIVVEKVLGGSARVDRLMVDLYLEGKAAAGYPKEEIERKRLALEGVLVPVTAKWNEELLHLAGFREVDCFWRSMNFAGWVAFK